MDQGHDNENDREDYQDLQLLPGSVFHYLLVTEQVSFDFGLVVFLVEIQARIDDQRG